MFIKVKRDTLVILFVAYLLILAGRFLNYASYASSKDFSGAVPISGVIVKGNDIVPTSSIKINVAAAGFRPGSYIKDNMLITSKRKIPLDRAIANAREFVKLSTIPGTKVMPIVDADVKVDKKTGIVTVTVIEDFSLAKVQGGWRKIKKFRYLVLFLLINFMIGTVSATCNIIVITDPSGRDPNGVAGASLSYAPNMFQSTFLLSKDKKFAVLSGGEGEAIPRLMAIVETIKRLENGMSAADAASAANQYPGIRVMCGGPGIGAAVGGSFDAYIVTVEDDGTIKITPVSGGLAVLPPGKREL